MESKPSIQLTNRNNKAASRHRIFNNWIGVAIAIFAISIFITGTHEFLYSYQIKSHIINFIGKSKYNLYEEFMSKTFFNPWFYGVFGLVLVLEQLIPAKKEQNVLSIGAWQDFFWIFLKLFVHATILPVYTFLLLIFYQEHLGFLTITAVSDWPQWSRVILALLFGDLVFWVGHYIRHKVQLLWHFHAVHHSQKELNFLTEYRVHPVDDAFIFTLGFIPYFMFHDSFIVIVAIVWIRHWHTRIYHSNIRSNFGFLKYIIVTPQSHRIHHSIEPGHRDKNYALTFSIWDYMFGTQYKGYDEYPDTGIEDEDFPFEQGRSRLDAFSLILEQLLYPFRAIVKGR